MGQDRKVAIQDHAAYLAGEHDFQADIERLAGSTLVGTILETVMLATRMRFAGVARVTADRWIACRTVDEIDFNIREGDEIEIGSTFCQTVRETSEMIIFGDVGSDRLYRNHPIATAFGIVSYTSVPIFRGDGSFFGTLCAIDPEAKDIANPRTVAMLQMFAELIGRSLETEERLEAQERLVEQERKLSRIQEEFTAILGHDLRNPVAALKAGVRRLENEPVTDRGRQLLSLMRASLQRMHELVENMMLHAKSRLGGGISILAQPDAPLAEAITHVVDEIRISAPEHRIKLDLDFAGPTNCDAARLAQAVSNLVSNAITHGAPGTPVTVRGRSGDGELTLAVANQGEAIPEETRQAMFQPFLRGKTSDAAGLGLGLHIAASIALAHGGILSVNCEDGTTTFSLSVPTR
ncbi:GAF domain-containing sensor histidine kinase [Paracoccus tibetensis]|uniref:histidine kinase n=1 Tax=Paracoccus tibetensis TaxID=336292 RepID=A0A1G5I5T3_9RHOB|nr:GAF domain-containing sensor histidine kinase [Paracoccus tibetensis]SCY71121.1 GAF sensor signal transduction histidine kinase [Paracoccus tibetensis]